MRDTPRAARCLRGVSRFELTQPKAVRVVILGQDPYPTPGHANGLAFSVHPGVPSPLSLRNILTELETDLGVTRCSGDLSDWARQGVLLLNTVLTVPTGIARGHASMGWQPLAGDVLAHVSTRPTAFLLWGQDAQRLGDRHIVNTAQHCVLKTSHPSPHSAHRGFHGSRPFSQVNAWLSARCETPVRWA